MDLIPGAAEVRPPVVDNRAALEAAELTSDVSAMALLHGYYCVKCADRDIYNLISGQLFKP